MHILIDECLPKKLKAEKNVEYQQNPDRFDIAVVVIVAYRNRLDALLPLMPRLQEVLRVIEATDNF